MKTQLEHKTATINYLKKCSKHSFINPDTKELFAIKLHEDEDTISYLRKGVVRTTKISDALKYFTWELMKLYYKGMFFNCNPKMQSVRTNFNVKAQLAELGMIRN